jgi:hypothetical protein
MLLRSARPFVVVLLLAVPGGPFVASSSAAQSQDAADPGAGSSSPAPAIEPRGDAGLPPADPDALGGLQAGGEELGPVPRPAGIEIASQRPAALVPLYISFATLQMLDAHSTTRALRHGRVEANPLMAPFAGNPAALAGVKAATAAGTIYVSERLRKRNRTAAIALMIALNTATAAIVAHNYRAP